MIEAFERIHAAGLCAAADFTPIAAGFQEITSRLSAPAHLQRCGQIGCYCRELTEARLYRYRIIPTRDKKRFATRADAGLLRRGLPQHFGCVRRWLNDSDRHTT